MQWEQMVCSFISPLPRELHKLGPMLSCANTQIKGANQFGAKSTKQPPCGLMILGSRSRRARWREQFPRPAPLGRSARLGSARLGSARVRVRFQRSCARDWYLLRNLAGGHLLRSETRLAGFCNHAQGRKSSGCSRSAGRPQVTYPTTAGESNKQSPPLVLSIWRRFSLAAGGKQGEKVATGTLVAALLSLASNLRRSSFSSARLANFSSLSCALLACVYKP